MDPILEIEHLEKHFLLHILNQKRIKALDDINLSLGSGEIVGLVGKSGSGKSTLMKCIYRTYLATRGRILYHAASLGPIDLAQAGDHQVLSLRKHEITYCAQFLHVIPRVSAIEVIASALHGRDTASQQAPEALAKTYLDRLGLAPELWDAYPATFSGGEQQRVNVAQAIISNPRLLLIDEPTASLDQTSKDVVIELILALKQRGSAVLVISHDPYTLERMCDRTVMLEHGKIAPPSKFA